MFWDYFCYELVQQKNVNVICNCQQLVPFFAWISTFDDKLRWHTNEKELFDHYPYYPLTLLVCDMSLCGASCCAVIAVALLLPMWKYCVRAFNLRVTRVFGNKMLSNWNRGCFEDHWKLFLKKHLFISQPIKCSPNLKVILKVILQIHNFHYSHIIL